MVLFLWSLLILRAQHSPVFTRTWAGSAIPESTLSGTVVRSTTVKFFLEDFLLQEGKKRRKDDTQKQGWDVSPTLDFLHPRTTSPVLGGDGLSQSLGLGRRTPQGLRLTTHTGQRHKHSSNTFWTFRSKASLTKELRPGSGTLFPEPVVGHVPEGQSIFFCEGLGIDFCAVCLSVRVSTCTQRVAKNMKRKCFSSLFNCT